jgi:hypothetical protein
MRFDTAKLSLTKISHAPTRLRRHAGARSPRPASLGWANEGDVVKQWKKYPLPPSVHDALVEPHRGQHFAAQAQAIVNCFTDTAVYTPPRGPTEVPVKKCVSSRRPGVDVHGRARANQSEKTPRHPPQEQEGVLRDQGGALQGLVKRRCNVVAAHNKRSRDGGASGDVDAFDAEVRGSKHQAVATDKRQRVLDARTVGSITDEEIAVLNYFLAVFFFMCNISFTVLGNYFFKAFIMAVRVAGAIHLQ